MRPFRFKSCSKSWLAQIRHECSTNASLQSMCWRDDQQIAQAISETLQHNLLLCPIFNGSQTGADMSLAPRSALWIQPAVSQIGFHAVVLNASRAPQPSPTAATSDASQVQFFLTQFSGFSTRLMSVSKPPTYTASRAMVAMEAGQAAAEVFNNFFNTRQFQAFRSMAQASEAPSAPAYSAMRLRHHGRLECPAQETLARREVCPSPSFS